MIIHNTEHTIFYIDPNKEYEDGAVSGDGSSVANASFHFPTTFKDNVIYLVRRSENGYFAKLPCNITTSNVTSLVILGMPVAGEKYYDELPAEVKTAWADPTIPSGQAWVCHYFSGSYEGRTGWVLNACRNFTMHGIVFTDYSSDNWDRPNFSISVSSTYGCNLDIQGCTFGFLQPNSTGATLFSMNTVNEQPDIHHGFRWIQVASTKWSNIATIKNVTIHCWGDSCALNLGKQKNIIIENVTVYCRTQSDITAAITCDYDEWRGSYAIIKNFNYRLVYSDNRDLWMQPGISMRVDRVKVDGVTAQGIDTQFRAPYRKTVGIRPVIDFASRFTGSVIENVTCNFPDFHGAAYSLVKFTYKHDPDVICSSPTRQYNEIRNITINMCQTEKSKYVNYNWDDSSANNFNSSSPGLLSLNGDGNRDKLISSDFLVQDIHLSGVRSNVLYGNGCILDLTDIDIVGNVSLYNCVGKIKSITSWYPGNILRDDGSNLLYIGKITCNLQNTIYSYNRQPAVIVSGKSNILVHEVNGNCWTSGYWDPAYPHSYICTNDGLAGNYTCRTGRSKCQTWSALCSSSDTGCSLKLINESGDDSHWPLRIGYDPFKGITKAVKAGQYNAIFYVAMYGYNIRFNEIQDRLFIRIKLPSGNYVYSNAGICEVDTESTWSNVEGTTNYKFTIPIDVETDGNLEIDFTWSFYMEGAMTFLDPYPKLVTRV